MHFFNLVLIPEDTKPEEIAGKIDAMLAPYDSNLEVAPYLDEDGDESTYNKQGHWDWWDFGGRWNGEIRNSYRGELSGFNFSAEFRQLEENIIHVKQIDHKVHCYAIITPDGTWHEHTGWGNTETQAAWDEEVTKLLQEHRNCFVIGIDCHD